MAKLNRKLQKVFGGAVAATDPRGYGNISQFGSLKEKSPEYTTDPEEIQSRDAYGKGWLGAVVNNNVAPLQDMNALQFLFSYQLTYLMQSGIPEWNSKQDYYKGSFCRHDSLIYVAKENIPVDASFDNSNPASDENRWSPYAAMSIGPTANRPKDAAIGHLHYDENIKRWITCAGREGGKSKWSTIEGAPGDIKEVDASVFDPKSNDPQKTLNAILEANPGWEFHSESVRRVVVCADPNALNTHGPGRTNKLDESITITPENLPPHNHALWGHAGTDRKWNGEYADKMLTDSKETAVANQSTRSDRYKARIHAYTDMAGGKAGSVQPIYNMPPAIYLWRLVKKY